MTASPFHYEPATTEESRDPGSAHPNIAPPGNIPAGRGQGGGNVVRVSFASRTPSHEENLATERGRRQHRDEESARSRSSAPRGPTSQPKPPGQCDTDLGLQPRAYRRRAPGSPALLSATTKPEAIAQRYATCVVEALDGARPVQQLFRASTAEVYAQLVRRAELAARLGIHGAGAQRTQLRSVRVCQVSPTVIEASAHFRTGRRSRAAALRFELGADRWWCTVLELG